MKYRVDSLHSRIDVYSLICFLLYNHSRLQLKCRMLANHYSDISQFNLCFALFNWQTVKSAENQTISAFSEQDLSEKKLLMSYHAIWSSREEASPIGRAVKKSNQVPDIFLIRYLMLWFDSLRREVKHHRLIFWKCSLVTCQFRSSVSFSQE